MSKFQPGKAPHDNIELLIASLLEMETECYTVYKIDRKTALDILIAKVAKALHGNAKIWWRGEREQGMTFSSVEELVEKLRACWGDRIHSLDIDRRLAEVVQGENTKIDEYIDNFYQKAKVGGVNDLAQYIPPLSEASMSTI